MPRPFEPGGGLRLNRRAASRWSTLPAVAPCTIALVNVALFRAITFRYILPPRRAGFLRSELERLFFVAKVLFILLPRDFLEVERSAHRYERADPKATAPQSRYCHPWIETYPRPVEIHLPVSRTSAAVSLQTLYATVCGNLFDVLIEMPGAPIHTWN